jgi:hypothetical protein
MKMEDHFKETLNRAVTNEPPVLDAWDRFERRLGRSRRWTLMASIAGMAAVIVAAVLVVPQLMRDDGTGVTTQPTSSPSVTPSPSPTVDPYAGWLTFENEEQLYRLKHPTWRVGMFEAVYEFGPPGLPATDARGAEDSFGVVVNVLDASLFDTKLAPMPSAGPSQRASDTEESRDGTVLYIKHRIDWSASRCITLGTACPKGDELYLLVTIQGEDTAELMGRYREIAELIVQSIEYVS